MSSVSHNSLVQCAITDRTPDYTLKVWRGMYKVSRKPVRTTPLNNQQNIATRGRVTNFTRKSRNRMIHALAQKDEVQRGLWMTVTYPDEVWFDRHYTNRDFQRDCEALFKRMERTWPGIGILWRKEWQDRKSGQHLGEYVPHLHMVTDGVLDDIADVRRWLRRAWYELLTDGSCDLPKQPRIDVKAVSNERQLMSYVSKYAAKLTEDEKSLCEYFHKHAGDIGRHWGVRGNWLRTVVAVAHLTRRQYLQLRRYARKSLHKRRRANLPQSLSDPDVRGHFGFWGTSGEVLWNSLIGRLLWHITSL